MRLRFSAAQKKTANTFTVFKTMPTSKHSKDGRSWLSFLRLEGRLDENPDGRRLRLTHAKNLTPLLGTASALAVFGDPPKSDRYVYGFQWGQKNRPIRLLYLTGC